MSMAHALENVSRPSTSPSEDITSSRILHTIFNSVSIAGAATLPFGTHASTGPGSSSRAAETSPSTSPAGGDSNVDYHSAQTRQSARFLFRGTHFCGSLKSKQQVTPLTVFTRGTGIPQLSSTRLLADNSTGSAAQHTILQPLQNKAQRWSKDNQCRHRPGDSYPRKQIPEYSPLSSKSVVAAGKGMASSPIGILDESYGNEENIPPHWDAEQGGVSPHSHAPGLKDHDTKSLGLKRATRRKPRGQDSGLNSHDLGGYVESLEAEVASLQTRLSALLTTPAKSSVNVTGHTRTYTTNASGHSSQNGDSDSHQRIAKSLQDTDLSRHEFETALQQKIQHLEEQMRDRDARCSLLEEQVRQSELRAQQAEAGERALSRRVDMFGAMVASSPAKTASLDTIGWATAPATPSMNEPSIDRQSSLRSRVAMKPLARSPSTANPGQPASVHHRRLSVQTEDHGSWHQGIGTAEPMQGNFPGDASLAIDIGDHSETASDLHSSNVDSTPPTSFGLADAREQSSPSRPISLLSNASFSASWGLPASLGRACTETAATCSVVSKRPTQQAKRMRRFPSTSGGLRPLILPNTAPCSEPSPTRSAFSLSPSRPVSMTEPFSLVSPLALNPESLDGVAFHSAPDREREQMRALRQLEGLEEEENQMISAESDATLSKFSGTLTNSLLLRNTSSRNLEQRCSTSLPADQKEVSSSETESDLLCREPALNSTPPRSITPRLSETPKAATHLSASTSAAFPDTLKRCGLKSLMPNNTHHEPTRFDGRSNEPSLSVRSPTLAGSKAGPKITSTARTGLLARFKALANLVISPKTMNETLLPLSDSSNHATQKLESGARNALAKSFGKATELFKQISPFRFGGLGWWLFGLSHWRRRGSNSSESHCDQERDQSNRHSTYGGALFDSTRTINDQGVNNAGMQRRLALDGPGECLVMRAEPVYSFVDEHTALLGFGLPSSTPVVTVTQASDSPTLMRNLRAHASRSVSSGCKARGAADQAIDYLLKQGRRQCPSCVEPLIRHRLRLWAKLGLALILAVGVAILDGPESILGISNNEGGTGDLPRWYESNTLDLATRDSKI